MSEPSEHELLEATLARRFVGRDDAFGTYDPTSRRTWQVKQVVTRADYARHVSGVRPLGIYPLVGDRVKFAAVDFDQPDTVPVAQFVHAIRSLGWHPHIERSKSKGFHCWFFFELAGVSAARVRAVLRLVLFELGMSTVEVFPKQDRLAPGEYGNFINLPLFGELVRACRTVFVDDAFQPVANQGKYLRDALTTPTDVIENSAQSTAKHSVGEEVVAVIPKLPPSTQQSASTWGLPPCSQRMLANGVTSFQRVSAFRLAVALRLAGFPRRAAQTTLTEWAKLNRPAVGKNVISAPEILAAINSGYGPRKYRGYGCSDPAVTPFCDKACRLYPKVRHER